MINNLDMVFFVPGDKVTIKHEISNRPIMLVKSKATKIVKEDSAPQFLGIKCFWFTTDGLYQEQVFSTKDLIKV